MAVPQGRPNQHDRVGDSQKKRIGRSFTIFVERWRCWLIGEAQLADFLQNVPELWLWLEAHGSIRVQEGEPPSFLIIARFEIIGTRRKPEGTEAAQPTLSTVWRSSGALLNHLVGPNDAGTRHRGHIDESNSAGIAERTFRVGDIDAAERRHRSV